MLGKNTSYSTAQYIRLRTAIQRKEGKVCRRYSNLSAFFSDQPTTYQEVICESFAERQLTGTRSLPMWLSNLESGELYLHYPIRLCDVVLN